MGPHNTQPESIFDALVYEVSAKLEAGETVDMESVGVEYPDHVDRLRQLLPTLQAVAELASSAPSIHAAPCNIDLNQGHDIGTVGDYHIIRELGRGGMGIVYEAEQVTVGRRVALKILPFAALLNQTQLKRFDTEATAAARLHHPNIVQVYSVGCERGIHFYAMQLVEGPSLSELIAEMQGDHDSNREGQETVDTVVARQADVLTRDDDGGHYRAVARIGREAAEALQYAHENGVLHRDIKPSNLLLDKTGHVWIADFGLARVEDESQLTRTGDILGTLRYMSPEQAKGDRVDGRSDVYSLGATLYELATLGPVYDAEDRRDIVKQVLAGSPIAPHKVDSSIPQPLSRVISKSMAQLDGRYQSAKELADDLQRFLDGEAVTAKPPTRLRRAKAWSRRHRVVASATITGLLILVLLLPFTHHFFGKAPDKGDDMRVSKTAKIAAAVAAVAIVATSVNAKKPPKDPPPDPEPGLTVSWELWGAYHDPQFLGNIVVEGGLVQQADGKFLNVGMSIGGDPQLGQATRWNLDGSVDEGFGNDQGRLTINVGDALGTDVIWDVAVQPGGEMVIVGSCNDYSSPWIARLHPDGSLDWIAEDVLPQDNALFNCVTVLSDGSIVAAGRIEDNPMSPLLVKFTADGDIDITFGIEGYSITDFGGASTTMWGKGFTELEDGRLIVPGSGPNYETSAVFVFNADGTPDLSFGNMGLAEVDIEPSGAEFFHSMALQDDGKIIAVGATSTSPDHSVVYHSVRGMTGKFTIARFNADGSLDKRKFAKPKGYQHLDLAAGGIGEFADVELLSDGRILVVGEGDPGDGVHDGLFEYDIYLARFLSNGRLDESFDNDGWINLHVADDVLQPSLVVLDDHHYMIGVSAADFEAWSWSPSLVLVSEEIVLQR